MIRATSSFERSACAAYWRLLVAGSGSRGSTEGPSAPTKDARRHPHAHAAAHNHFELFDFALSPAPDSGRTPRAEKGEVTL